ncbi:unnamed protein product [Cylicocyclus nassatus]|uniref:Phospholipid scramblase n=1 Tax=Cylicocyclus nassatus TaxID=53992 RepID=A0AA36DS14_CYLNA|nr:unnamed protein product [Cylicocyclus nassatus]
MWEPSEQPSQPSAEQMRQSNEPIQRSAENAQKKQLPPPPPGAPVRPEQLPLPPPIEGVPPGLEYLTMIDEIVIHQLIEILELASGVEIGNKYSLRNVHGEQAYYAFEESTCLQRQFCCSLRKFILHVVDNFKREVIIVRRPLRLCAGGCFGLCACIQCCSGQCSVESPPGNVIGTVEQRQACCATCFDVRDANGELLYEVNGPCCIVLCGCQNKHFPIYTTSKEKIGVITKVWGGYEREVYTKADIFKVTFSMDLDVLNKAILIGATFLIDYMEFENQQMRQ